MVSCVATSHVPVPRNGYNTVMALLSVAVLCLLIHATTGEVSSDGRTTQDMATRNTATPLNCPPCPKQITTCPEATADFKPTECNSTCLGCDELLPMAKAQLNMNNRILRQLDEMRKNTPSIDPETNPSALTHRPRDCKEVQTAGFETSGRYIVYPDDDEDPFPVFCDMDTDGGGWTVFQRRKNRLLDFYRTWSDYKYGFGTVLDEHWLGNEKIHRLTSQKTYELRVDLADFDGKTRYAEYDQFLLGDESLYYLLIIGDYSGNAGDSLTYHHGAEFSAKDRDLDTYSDNCAVGCKGAWWYKSCHRSNLNGEYRSEPNPPFSTGVNWKEWKGPNYSLKETEMKIRPRN